MAGYSGTPLAKKLGIKPGTRAACREPAGGLPGSSRASAGECDIRPGRAWTSSTWFIFSQRTRSELIKLIDRYKTKIKQDGAIWVSWPKKASGIPSEITEDTVREVALPLGLVDIKVCAVDDTWSGLKLVIRKENRRG